MQDALPASTDPKGSSTTIPQAILDSYAKDPAYAYRKASEAVQAALDRKLLADTVERSLEQQVLASPADAANLATIAHEKLADRPDVADRLRQRALKESEARVASMRQAELEELARIFRDQGEEERARRLIQSWLADRRKNRLSATDAEGRILLAASYDKLLNDRLTAADLLREALAIDPQSKGAVDAFLRMGFRKNDNGWYDPSSAKTNPNDPVDSVANPDQRMGSADRGDTLRGLTRAQVRSRLGGKPDLIIRSASQGRCVEQWIYKNGKGIQVIRFEPTSTEPRVSASYSDKK
jgi:tetratricopeptide (TPR) repeat protein